MTRWLPPEIFVRHDKAYLPSVESQTIRCVELMRAYYPHYIDKGWNLRWQGIDVYLRYWPTLFYVPERHIGETLVIAKVWMPPRYRQRGWFWRYVQLCLLLTRDAVVVECVQNPGLLEALRRRKEFEEVLPTTFLIRRTTPGDWPLCEL